MSVDLNALRIEHPDPVRAGRRGSRTWMVLFFVLLAVSTAAIVYLLRFAPRTEAVAVPVEQAARAVAAARDEAIPTGAFSAAGWVKLPRYHPVLVTPLAEGRVEEIRVIEGDRVTSGQVIARLWAEDFRAALTAAEAAVKAAEAEYAKRRAGYRKQEVAEARAEVERLEAELKTARAILENSEKLRPSGAIPEEEWLRDATRVETLTAALAQAGERLALLEEGFRREDIALAEAALEKARAERELARLRVGYAEIKSPMDGVVLQRLAARGQWIRPGEQGIVSLYDPADLEARVDVNQDDIARVFRGQKVEITSRAEPDRVHRGEVVLIEPQADLVKNTVPVRVKILDSADRVLHPDMVVKARFLPKAGGPERPAPRGAGRIPVDPEDRSDG